MNVTLLESLEFREPLLLLLALLAIPIYLLAARKLNVQPQDCLVLEDSPNGVTSAKAAGLFCVAIPTPLTSQMELGHADMQVASLMGLSLTDISARLDPRA